MGLLALIIGLDLFIGAHVLVSLRDRRAALLARLGELPYKALFSVASIAGIALIAWGFGHYRAGGYIDLWHPPVWTKHLALLLMWPALIMFVAAYRPGRIKSTLKHPMLAGVKLWAVAHLIANGDLGSIILFGSILAWAVYDRISLKYRTDPGGPVIPPGGKYGDITAIAVGTVAYLIVVFWFHPSVIGVPVL